MPYNAAALFVGKEVEISSRPALIRSSYDILTVILESRRITYGGDSGSSDDWGLSSDWCNNDEAEYFIIVETGGGILFMVPQTRESLC